MTKEGRIESCPEYTTPILHNGIATVCKNTCDISTQIVLLNGECLDCEKCTRPDEENLKCIQDECSDQ